MSGAAGVPPCRLGGERSDCSHPNKFAAQRKQPRNHRHRHQLRKNLFKTRHPAWWNSVHRLNMGLRHVHGRHRRQPAGDVPGDGGRHIRRAGQIADQGVLLRLARAAVRGREQRPGHGGPDHDLLRPQLRDALAHGLQGAHRRHGVREHRVGHGLEHRLQAARGGAQRQRRDFGGARRSPHRRRRKGLQHPPQDPHLLPGLHVRRAGAESVVRREQHVQEGQRARHGRHDHHPPG
mmetsp:Transcript_66056/g.157643  ORF Transcript_66056/g.157643 Transcript_66056/m.157643 type:complete len:235 (+) Transcript_66056:352-1056(+)